MCRLKIKVIKSFFISLFFMPFFVTASENSFHLKEYLQQHQPEVISESEGFLNQNTCVDKVVNPLIKKEKSIGLQ